MRMTRLQRAQRLLALTVLMASLPACKEFFAGWRVGLRRHARQRGGRRVAQIYLSDFCAANRYKDLYLKVDILYS